MVAPDWFCMEGFRMSVQSHTSQSHVLRSHLSPSTMPLRRWLLGCLLPGLAGLSLAAPVLAGPVVCTTTLEAPPSPATATDPGSPVEVTRCDTVQTVPALMERRYFSYTAPFARSVSLTNQITDLFGIAMGGGDGTRVMGLGFADQTIIWDGTAIQNTYQFLLDQQSDPTPWRTGDVSNGFSGSLGGAR
jgi:hypothetical protein